MSTREPARTPREVLALIRESEVKAVDLRFMDFPGLWQHFTIPAEALDEDDLRGRPRLRRLQHPRLAGDQRVRHARRARSRTPRFIDPFCKDTTLTMICNIQDPLTKEDYTRDPRNVARKAVNYMKTHRHRRHRLLRPGARVLRLRRRPLRPDAALGVLLPRLASKGPGTPAATRSRTSATSCATRKGYFPCPPTDTLHDLRTEMMLTMIECGMTVESPAPRSRHRRPVRDRHALRRRWSRWPTTC